MDVESTLKVRKDTEWRRDIYKRRWARKKGEWRKNEMRESEKRGGGGEIEGGGIDCSVTATLTPPPQTTAGYPQFSFDLPTCRITEHFFFIEFLPSQHYHSVADSSTHVYVAGYWYAPRFSFLMFCFVFPNKELKCTPTYKLFYSVWTISLSPKAIWYVPVVFFSFFFISV